MKNNNRNQYNQNWNADNDSFDDNNYNQQRSGQDYENRGGFGNTSYGDQYGRQNDWNQARDNTSGNSYGNDYNNYRSSGNWNNDRQDSDRQRRNTGSSYGNTSYNDWDNRRNYDNYGDRRGPRDWWERTKDEVSSWFGNDDADRRRTSENRNSGAHRGKGPKGYTRSDDRIREDVHDRLSDDSYVDASDIEVKVENCEVVLTGNVSNREEKRRAEDLVEAVSGVRNVENRIRVNSDRSSYGDVNQRRGNYTGTTSDVGNIGTESGTTNEVIRNSGTQSTNR